MTTSEENKAKTISLDFFATIGRLVGIMCGVLNFITTRYAHR